MISPNVSPSVSDCKVAIKGDGLGEAQGGDSRGRVLPEQLQIRGRAGGHPGDGQAIVQEFKEYTKS